MLSKSLKIVDAKMVHQMQMSVQQQARHPMLTCVYLPSAPVGGMKLYQTSKKSVELLAQEQEHLGREMRAAQALYTSTGPRVSCRWC